MPSAQPVSPDPISDPTSTPTNLSLSSPTPVTVIQKPEEENLSAASSMKTNQLPDDVLSEIWFLTGGGGYSGCPSDNGKPYFPGKESDEQLELHETYTLHACGFKNNEFVEITAIDNDGKVIDSLEETFKENHAILYDFQTHIFENSTGHYSVYFEAASGTLLYEVDVVLPSGARVFWEENDTVILYGFKPNESVALFVYGIGTGKPAPSTASGSHYILKAWEQYYVDENGNLIIHPSINEKIYWVAVVGEKTGEVKPVYNSSPEKLYGINPPTIIGVETTHQASSGSASSQNESWPVSNNGVEACHLEIGQTVTILGKARAWSGTDVTNANVVKTFNPETKVKVTDGPEWGRIRLDIDYSGWWWLVSDQTGDEIGWVWQGILSECSQ